MDKIKRFFFEYNLNWMRLILYSVICGVLTGLIMLISCLADTSISNIGACYEAWVMLALFIILNSKKPFEAGIKTFVFFLISQPLCYLVQVPFFYDGFGIFRYYAFWFKLTLLTFPGAIIAWYVKKDKWYSVAIFSIATILLGLEAENHFYTLIKTFPYQLLAVLFIVFEVIFFAKLLFGGAKKRLVIYSVFIISAVFLYINTSFIQSSPACIYLLDDANDYEIRFVDEGVDVKLFESKIEVNGTQNGNFRIILKKDEEEIEFEYTKKNEVSELLMIENEE